MTEIYEREDLKNQRRIFKDRFDAGRVLAAMLEPVFGGAGNLIVLAIPLGGIPVAVKIAERLQCPLELAIVRKIQIPGNTEAGFGAITGEGDVFLNEPLMFRLNLRPDQVEQQSRKVRAELAERDRRLRGNRSFPALENKIVLIVDDGLASGFTMKAAVYMASKRRARRTVVAVPTASRHTLESLDGAVDAVFCANVREERHFAVAEAYADWYDLSEAEAAALLAERSWRTGEYEP